MVTNQKIIVEDDIGFEFTGRYEGGEDYMYKLKPNDNRWIAVWVEDKSKHYYNASAILVTFTCHEVILKFFNSELGVKSPSLHTLQLPKQISFNRLSIKGAQDALYIMIEYPIDKADAEML